MKNIITTTIRTLIRRFGIDIVRYPEKSPVQKSYPPDFGDTNIEICEAVKTYTGSSQERLKDWYQRWGQVTK